MTQGPKYRPKLRRQREKKTDYRRRLKLLRSGKTRLVVRKTLKNMIVQFVNYNPSGDEVVASAEARELESQYNWKFSTASTPAAYLTGLLAGIRAKEAGIKECVLDIGLHPPVTGSRLFGAVNGVIEAGVSCPHDPDKLPQENRLKGEHINKDVAPAVDTIKNKITGGKTSHGEE